jgi:environmental stress-induced protein Ves
VSGFAIIRSADHKVMPWKNGGGETAEIAVSPAGAALDAFDWRLSMARVETDGPFSAFPGIDRTLAILEGEGVRLSVEGEPAVTLTNKSSPHAFRADVETSATLVGGPILDLNVMSRRGRVEHTVTRLRGDAIAEVPLADTTLLFCAEGTVEIEFAGIPAMLARHDTLVWRGGPATATLGRWELSLLYVVSLRRR